MECLDLALNGLNDAYTAAVMAYAFALARQPCIDKAIDLLNDLAVQERKCILSGTDLRNTCSLVHNRTHVFLIVRFLASFNFFGNSYVFISS